MPRISAENIPQHVARQRVAVLDAAARLFTESDVDSVSLGDIAASVGLARNSLYRYFPDKSHIVMAWFHREIEPLKLAGDRILAKNAVPHTQLDEWVTLHFDYLSQRAHHMMITAVSTSAAITDQTHSQISAGHSALYDSLRSILERFNLRLSAPEPSVGVEVLDVDVLVALIVGMIRSAAQLVVEGGLDPVRVRRSLLAALHAVTD